MANRPHHRCDKREKSFDGDFRPDVDSERAHAALMKDGNVITVSTPGAILSDRASIHFPEQDSLPSDGSTGFEVAPLTVSTICVTNRVVNLMDASVWTTVYYTM